MISLYLGFLSLVTSLLVLANPVPEPTPAAVLEDRSACTQDNCLRALSNHATSASPYCSSYLTATQTATTGFPTYIPSTCGPSRVSSACTCLALPPSTSSTSTAAQCTHTGQVSGDIERPICVCLTTANRRSQTQASTTPTTVTIWILG